MGAPPKGYPMITKQEAYFYAAMAAVVAVLFWAKPAEGAEIECEEVQVVDAWSKEFGRWIPASFYDCESFSYTEPEVDYEVLGGEIVWFIVEEGEFYSGRREER